MGSRHPIPHGGVYQRDRYPPLDLIQWVYQMERDRKVRAADVTVPARHEVRYCTQSGNTHVSHVTHTVIYYSNKSLAPPNFLWISISPWTYLHWSTSGVRMCQASLTVTLKNGSQISAIRVCVCVCVCLLCVCVRVRRWDLCTCSISVQRCRHRRGFTIQILESE